MRLILARTWTLREKGLLQISEVLNRVDQVQGFEQGIFIVQMTLSDKIVGVVAASMQLL